MGENGTGKTTLLKYITELSYWLSQKNKKTLAVYDEAESLFVIHNLGKHLTYDGAQSTVYIDSNGGEFIDKISHIYLTNSEYAENINLTSQTDMDSQKRIQYISINNSILNSLAKRYYDKTVNFSRRYVSYDIKPLNDTKFNALQWVIIQNLNNLNFQAILDINFYGNKAFRKEDFIGKSVDIIDISFINVADILYRNKDNITYPYLTEHISGKMLDKEIPIFRERTQKSQSKINSILINNLFFELDFCYSDNGFPAYSQDEKNLYGMCKKYIEDRIESGTEKEYFQRAIDEIETIMNLSLHPKDNGFPQDDGSYQEFFSIDAQVIRNLILHNENQVSFISKYLKVLNLGMSSGERALLNFMSRLEYINDFSGDNKIFRLNEDILLLFDEVDLYIHPEWQRRFLDELIKEINKTFSGKNVQIILTSHSPIILSDLPRENIILLEKMDASKNILVLKSDHQTFGANIYTLFKDAFFIKDGLGIGVFAKRYIDALIKDLQKLSGNSNHKKLKERINLIGDPLIKNKLLQLLSEKKHGEKDETFLKNGNLGDNERINMISFLEKQVDELNRQIAVLRKNNND